MSRSAAVFALAAAWVVIAVNVLYGGPISAADVALAERVAVDPDSRLALVLAFWSTLHSDIAVLVLATVFVLLLARRRAWAWAESVVLAVPGAMVLNTVLKVFIRRSRPVLDNPILALNTYSFPSSHVAAAAAFYGVLAAYLAFRFPRQRAFFVAGAAVLVASVGYSRMALGEHYFGDVLGALASTGAWLAASLGVVHSQQRRK